MFKVGDIITGADKEEYGITTDDATMEILRVIKRAAHSDLWVEVLSHKSKEKRRFIGSRYYVSSRHFVLAKPKFKGNK